MGKYFRTVPRMTAFDKISHTILGCLNSSLEGNGSYQWMVQKALESGETFHAVEDDEE